MDRGIDFEESVWDYIRKNKDALGWLPIDAEAAEPDAHPGSYGVDPTQRCFRCYVERMVRRAFDEATPPGTPPPAVCLYQTPFAPVSLGTVGSPAEGWELGSATDTTTTAAADTTTTAIGTTPVQTSLALPDILMLHAESNGRDAPDGVPAWEGFAASHSVRITVADIKSSDSVGEQHKAQIAMYHHIIRANLKGTTPHCPCCGAEEGEGGGGALEVALSGEAEVWLPQQGQGQPWRVERADITAMLECTRQVVAVLLASPEAVASPVRAPNLDWCRGCPYLASCWSDEERTRHLPGGILSDIEDQVQLRPARGPSPLCGDGGRPIPRSVTRTERGGSGSRGEPSTPPCPLTPSPLPHEVFFSAIPVAAVDGGIRAFSIRRHSAGAEGWECHLAAEVDAEGEGGAVVPPSDIAAALRGALRGIRWDDRAAAVQFFCYEPRDAALLQGTLSEAAAQHTAGGVTPSEWTAERLFLLLSGGGGQHDALILPTGVCYWKDRLRGVDAIERVAASKPAPRKAHWEEAASVVSRLAATDPPTGRGGTVSALTGYVTEGLEATFRTHGLRAAAVALCTRGPAESATTLSAVQLMDTMGVGFRTTHAPLLGENGRDVEHQQHAAAGNGEPHAPQGAIAPPLCDDGLADLPSAAALRAEGAHRVDAAQRIIASLRRCLAEHHTSHAAPAAPLPQQALSLAARMPVLWEGHPIACELLSAKQACRLVAASGTQKKAILTSCGGGWLEVAREDSDLFNVEKGAYQGGKYSADILGDHGIDFAFFGMTAAAYAPHTHFHEAAFSGVPDGITLADFILKDESPETSEWGPDPIVFNVCLAKEVDGGSASLAEGGGGDLPNTPAHQSGQGDRTWFGKLLVHTHIGSVLPWVRSLTQKGVSLRVATRYSDINGPKVMAALMDLAQCENTDNTGSALFLEALQRGPGELNGAECCSVGGGVNVVGAPLSGGGVGGWGLTDSQESAYCHLESHRVQVVWGPPGTGKTRYLAAAVARHLEAVMISGVHDSYSIAVTSVTKAAFGELMGVLRDVVARRPAGVWQRASLGLQEGKEGDVSWVSAKSLCSGGGGGGRGRGGRGGGGGSAMPFTILGCTVWHLGKTKGDSLYDMLVVDEASQMPTTDVAVAFRKLKGNARVVVAGDHLQLPPIHAAALPARPGCPDLSGSLLKALMRHADGTPIQGVDDNSSLHCSVVKLTENMRSNHTICAHTQRLYGTDYHVPSGAPPRLLLLRDSHQEVPPVWHNLQQALLQGAKWRNGVLTVVVSRAGGMTLDAEARAAAGLLIALNSVAQKAVGQDFGALVVAPTNLQCHTIRDQEGFTTPVTTCNKAQGQTVDVAVLAYASRTNSFGYQLERINVAMTRARCLCVLLVSGESFDPWCATGSASGFAHALSFIQQSPVLEVVMADSTMQCRWLPHGATPL